ncbi:hypothetical protein NDU88_003321 [Pleurodeles waltl]|uniref:Uncharacterized protein n=1 Tax=Pleurodeles waltl TaxID=8319 RepID=A0AAV7W5Q8_PLEWA|nr:hypothetical protein NDU88_003321 [Pleurodeles waltl]
MLGRPRLGKMGEEELGVFIWLVCHFLPLMIEACGRVIQGYHTEGRRIRWGKVLYHLQRVYRSQRNDHQLRHRWADLISREQDLLDHLGIVIGGPVAANMIPIHVREFQRRAMQYQHILQVESGYRRMARRYRTERASGAWRAFPQGGPSLPTTATTSTTTTTQVAPATGVSVVPTTSGSAPGPNTEPPSGQPTGIEHRWPHTSTAGTQTTPAATIDLAAFVDMQRQMDRVLRKMSRLRQDVRHINRRVRSIKRTLQRANL